MFASLSFHHAGRLAVRCTGRHGILYKVRWKERRKDCLEETQIPVRAFALCFRRSLRLGAQAAARAVAVADSLF
ncbi:MAG: hypothetical protein AB1656_00700 [Candidatus Omnitrophota bacterium]